VFLVVSGQSGFTACPLIRKLLKPSGERALRPDSISFLMGADYITGSREEYDISGSL
jgi:hypothetical protein